MLHRQSWYHFYFYVRTTTSTIPKWVILKRPRGRGLVVRATYVYPALRSASSEGRSALHLQLTPFFPERGDLGTGGKKRRRLKRGRRVCVLREVEERREDMERQMKFLLHLFSSSTYYLLPLFQPLRIDTHVFSSQPLRASGK